MNDDLGIATILQAMPHRYPFLLLDRILDYVPGQSIRALKNVSINEPFFQGHFPGHPIMPGVLILEAMAQATGMLAYYSNRARGGDEHVYYLVGIDKARFKRPVGAGDQLVMEARLLREMRGIFRFEATASVDGELAAAGEFMTTQRAK
ncbi:MAG: 3-hydroxyacyl-ACP dehydratase FabZ [Gammaproteobacteria bacterium]